MKFRDSRTIGDKKEDLLSFRSEQFMPQWAIYAHKLIDDPMRIANNFKFNQVQKTIGHAKYRKDIRWLVHI